MTENTLSAVFLVDDKLDLYMGARCELPTGEVVEVQGRKTPFFALARVLAEMACSDWRLQIYTPTGTPSLRGLVSKMAKLTVEESDKGGLRLRKYRPFPPGRSLTDAQVGPEGTQTPDKAEMRVSDSHTRDEAA